MQLHTAYGSVTLGLVAALALSFPASAAPRRTTQGPDAAAKLKLAGDKFKAAGDTESALAQYQKALAADPSHQPTLQEYAQTLYATEDFEAAAEQFQKLVELAPDDPVGWYNLGYALRQQKDYESASTAFEHYISAHPTDPDGYYALAECLRVLGKHVEAAKQYDLYVEKETRPEEAAWVEKAKNKSAAMKTAAAAVAARSIAPPVRPSAPTPSVVAPVATATPPAVARPQQPAAPEPAKPAVAALSNRDPRGAVYQIREGDQMFQQKRFREALEAYQNAVRLDDQSTNAMLKAGLAMANLGQYAEAISQWERVLELDSNNKYATSYIERARPRVEASQASASPKPVGAGDASAKGRNAEAQPAAGKPVPAVATPQPSAQDVALARSEYRKAVGLINSSQFAEALAPLQIAIERQPDFVNAYVARGGAYLGLRRYNDAAADYRKSLELAPDLATPLYGLGRVYEKLGNKPKAVEYYRRYASSNGPDAQVSLKRRADQAADALSR